MKREIVRPCEVCCAPIPDRWGQNPATVRACRPYCAGVIFKHENPGFAHWVRATEEGAES